MLASVVGDLGGGRRRAPPSHLSSVTPGCRNRKPFCFGRWIG